MQGRNKVITALVAFAALTSIACDQKATQDHPKPQPHPEAGKYPHNQPNRNAPKAIQQPEPPPADPGPYQDPKQAVFKLVAKTGERSGSYVEYTLNGSPIHLSLPDPKKQKDGSYYIIFQYVVSVPPGSTIGFDFYPENPVGTWSICTLYHNGQVEDYQIAYSYGCSVSLTS